MLTLEINPQISKQACKKLEMKTEQGKRSQEVGKQEIGNENWRMKNETLAHRWEEKMKDFMKQNKRKKLGKMRRENKWEEQRKVRK